MSSRPKRLRITDIPQRTPPLSKETAATAMVVAVAVRNGMEDFHCKHLSDAQMRELNPIIRNAVATALYALQHMKDNILAQQYVAWHLEMIPSYWERPVLLKSFSRAGYLRAVGRLCRATGSNTRKEIIKTAEGMLGLGARFPSSVGAGRQKRRPRC